MTLSNKDLICKINKLKQEKNCIILSHYYTDKEVQKIADFTGDSLALSQKAAENDADMILFAGVRFMAETAKVLSPHKKVLLPVMTAGCSLADSCDAEQLRKFKEDNPDYMIVSYVNTSVQVKALTDVCCTSSNALKIVSSIPAARKIMFTPDMNLGGYVKRMTGRDNMMLWNGACHVHDAVTPEQVMEMKNLHPEAKILVHPECRSDVVALADYAGSTKGIIDYSKKDESREFIIVTESGVMYELEREMPDKVFYSIDNDKHCVQCEYMKQINLHNILETLENESPEIIIEEKTRSMAEKSIRAMLAVK